MRIACLGGGPAGLYFAISMKLRDPACDIVVFERNRPDDTFGWGVVLSVETLDNLASNDPESAAAIRAHFAAMQIGMALDDTGELDLETPRHDHAVLGLHKVGNAALARLAVDADHRIVGAADIGRVDREVGH